MRSTAQRFGRSGPQPSDECCSGSGAQPQEEERMRSGEGDWVTMVMMIQVEGNEGWWMRRRGRRLRGGERGGESSWRCCFVRGRTTWSGSHQLHLNTRYVIVT